MNEAISKVENILTKPFNMTGYVELVRELFSTIKIIAPNEMRKEYSNFSSHVEASAHVGSYTTLDGKLVAVFAVQLKQLTYVSNSRSTQRSFARKLIENGNCDAALIAFYTLGDNKWRLSFVVLDYEMKIEDGKMTTEDKLTPARRYSYLVGEGEPCHTAISRFGKFIRDNNSQPTLEEMREAFSVEAVTKEFFDLYCEKFYQLVECLDANEAFKEESARCGFSTEQFAKKLLGQIVFLYFLQKKGWLGVGVWPVTITEKEYNKAFWCKSESAVRRKLVQQYLPSIYAQNGDTYKFRGRSALEAVPDDIEEIIANNMPGDRKWGSGSKTFLRTWFNFADQRGGKFYDDYLEPLFYATLNKNRGDLGYSSILHCRVPFLSGGLFEPIDGYDWENTEFNIPNEIFSNAKTKDDLEADGILDVFDRYNFTMSEDEPMEREVAIDPEMLGKVFENLLDVKDRKSKGAFYTPREIVHYMCQESLINYLKTNSNISEGAIRSFILYGDFYKDTDTEKTKRVTDVNGKVHYEFDIERELKISPEIFDLKNNVNRLNEIDELLKNIRVADPAVGSGAFPLGMLNEIVRARENLTAYMSTTMDSFQVRMMRTNERSAYQLKYDTIRNCIFAADLEPSAVDIAQLRLWLALVIDDEINPDAQTPLDGHRNPLPLPNLECNIVCGNSLIDEFEGHKLIPQHVSLGTDNVNQEYSWNQMEIEALIPKLVEAQNRLFVCDDPLRKEQIKAEIEVVKDQMVRAELALLSNESMERYEESKRKASKPYVLWQVEFARVFQEKGGFDVVIGNPPYIQLQKSISDDGKVKLGDLYEKQGFKSFAKTGDIYCLFYEKGYQLLHEGGTLAFITSNKWMRAGYGEKLRGFFAQNTNPLYLIDFAGQKVFESATVDVNILIYEKAKNQGNTMACIVKEKCGDNLSVYVQQNSSVSQLNTHECWTILSTIEQNLRRKIKIGNLPLSQWNVSINYGIKTGFNDAFIISTQKRDELIAADAKSAEIIRPILRGRDIKRYEYDFAGLYIIATFPSKHYNIDEYPAIKKHLLSFDIKRLEQSGNRYISNGIEIKSRKKTSNKWFETQDSINYWNDFSKQKIAYRQISTEMNACLVEEQYMLNDKCYFITGKHLIYLLAYLNSNLFEKIFFQQANTTGGKGEGFLEKIPVAFPNEILEKKINYLYHLRNTDVKKIDSMIDNLFCALYGLTSKERDYISS